MADSYAEMWEKHSRQRDGQCGGPEAGMCLAEKSKRSPAAGADRSLWRAAEEEMSKAMETVLAGHSEP